MSPPIDIDGSEIQEATIDGQDVSEITIDGQQAADLIGIPDTSMFQNPIYQWTAQAGIGVSDGSEASSWDDQLASLTASSVGNPLFRADQAGFEAVEYDGSDDAHNYTSNADAPTGQSALSFAALVYINDVTVNNSIASYGPINDSEGFELSIEDGNVRADLFFQGLAESGNPSANAWLTVGGSLGTDGTVKAYLNGSSVATDDQGNPNLTQSNESLGYRRPDNSRHLNGFIAEVIVCAAEESSQAFSDYDTDRLG